jgi:hypothetical protein
MMIDQERVEEEDVNAEDEAQPEPPKQQDDLLPPGCGMWFAWLFTSTLGTALGWGLGWQVSFILPGAIATVMLAAVTGLVLGALQWLVLRGQLKGSAWWILASAAGWGVGFPAGAAVAQSLGLTDWAFGLAVGAVTGAAAGLAQWLFLSRHLPRTIWWIPVSIFAWTASLVYYRADAVWLGLLYGALYGIVSGVALVWLLYGPAPE